MLKLAIMHKLLRNRLQQAIILNLQQMEYVKNLYMVNVNKDNIVHILMINRRLKLARNFRIMVCAPMARDAILVMI